MSRPGTKGSNPSGKVMNADDGIQEVVPLSLQKLRELADSLRSSMPEENNVGSPSPSRVGRKGRLDYFPFIPYSATISRPPCPALNSHILFFSPTQALLLFICRCIDLSSPLCSFSLLLPHR
uniref:Uncharacterized protein n=1 Tax=Guillardia theta TaxID=55529 RepID=A0A7S4L0B0_GUITH